ncbi:hypothetical protein [Cellulomonas carbonis]|uniref:Uncharacterized protein n=1 Tax=Cellulomonas carbonis T26 TaxID=947969 RepID=A0A0A0BQZ7_9CELL|nr:hypothetical protein [Cellulomonas carbonis]KGM10893.1 hypothetical protein N868_08585 [Cellulomonas carbonis T26]MDT0164593.1 hypothetical protein [Actinotalea sp. AC32]GGC00460.1 hypothetical protein GCM10010972_11530 [Cellulomonas carbonis]
MGLVSTGRRVLGVAAAMALAVGVAAAPASANSDSDSRSYGGVTLSTYVYIDDWSGWDNCGYFRTYAKTSKQVAALTHSVEWDPIGIGASATIKGVGVSISGNSGGSPTATFTNRYTTYAGMSGTACASWSTVYLGVFSSGSTKVGGHYLTSTSHV